MMDIEKLIEDLREPLKQYGEKIPYGELVGAPWPYSRAGDLVWQDPEPYFIEHAALALHQLQAENESLKEKLYDGDGVNLVDYWMQQAKIEENGHRNCQAENEKLQEELEQVKHLYESEKEDFIDFACSGVPNLSPYCMNRHPDCVDERGWCRTEKCRGFSRERDSQKED